MRPFLRYIAFSGIAFVALICSFSPSHAQERCATVEYSKALHPDYELRRLEFEKWISEKKIPRTRREQRQKQQTTAYKIPVVVHIIHNGEPIGTGSNISEAQVLSQIRVLNEDFNRQNADAANTPAVFASVAGALDIEFVLAKQDEDGLPTNGIVRVDGGRNGWTVNDNYTLKALSYWPADEYMNIWVCNLTDNYVGYAQLPESNLPGHENSSKNRFTDGVVIWHKAFGSSDDGAFNLDPVFNKGRTTTHEVGHFLGLMHTWGDDAGCSGSDYVSDTPNQANQTQGCPSHPRSDACSEVVMFQNFLDYSDDDCMNLFTQGQVERMSIVIENSPRRSTLLSSPGLEEPDPLPNDVGIRRIVFPDASVCSNEVTPRIEVRNYGSNAVTSARVQFVLDGSVQETRDFALSLNPDESVEVTFSAVSLSSGTHDISFEVQLTNGGTDSGSYNDLEASTVIVPAFRSVPFADNMDTAPAGWITYNPDGQITWARVTAPSETANNKALKLNYFKYEDKIGEIDAYLSPVLDLSAVPAATLTFDVAHARYQSSNDRLQVVVLTNCQEITDGTIVYDKAGSALRTAPSTTSEFTPLNESQWRTEIVNLSSYIGTDKVQIAFVGINDWGNNIYLDNIALHTDPVRDVSLVRLVSPSVVTCGPEVTPVLQIRNAGTIPLDDVIIEYSVDDGPVQTLSAGMLNVAAGKEIALPAISLANGMHTLAVNLVHPGGLPDSDESNNQRSFMIAVNDQRDRIPIRVNFEEAFTPAWTIINPSGGMNWETIATNSGQSLYFNAYNNEEIGEESWFVSPVLDFTRTVQASMLMDVSYNPPPGATKDELRIMASKNCGMTFESLAFELPDTGSSSQPWAPTQDEHWSRNLKVDLNGLAGEENVRIAFVVHNQGANNLYLDNIEFFTTADPDPIELSTLYSVYGYDLEQPGLTELKITFNLTQRQDVRFSVVNVLGQMETDGMITDVLNQTYPIIPRGTLKPGIYFIRVHIGEKFHTTKILIH